METLSALGNIEDSANNGLPVDWHPASTEQLAGMADATAREQLGGMPEITPLTASLSLYVDIKWADPSQDVTMKTTYSTQSEADAD